MTAYLIVWRSIWHVAHAGNMHEMQQSSQSPQQPGGMLWAVRIFLRTLVSVMHLVIHVMKTRMKLAG